MKPECKNCNACQILDEAISIRAISHYHRKRIPTEKAFYYPLTTAINKLCPIGIDIVSILRDLREMIWANPSKKMETIKNQLLTNLEKHGNTYGVQD